MQGERERRIYSMIGLARKAGKIRSGNFQTEDALKTHRACLVILASDAKKNTSDRFTKRCIAQGVPFRVFGTAEDLGGIMGQELRSCAAVTDAGFAQSLMKLIDKEERGQNGEDENQ